MIVLVLYLRTTVINFRLKNFNEVMTSVKYYCYLQAMIKVLLIHLSG